MASNYQTRFIDWEKILESHKKSFQLIVDWYKTKNLPTRMVASVSISPGRIRHYFLNESSDRWLYDFFDEQGIICYSDYSNDVNNFGYTISISKETKLFSIKYGYNTRIEAEKDMFMEALDVIESRLN